MPSFSQIHGLNLNQAQLDFVDITPESDTPLFIDPYALSMKSDEWSQRCHHHIVDYFQTALEFVRLGDQANARALLNGLSEPNETCLGISRGAPAGRGVSGKQALDLYESLAQSEAAKNGLLSELADCDLFVEGIGPDKISDITTNIIRRLLIEYTQAQCGLHGIELTGSYPAGRFWDVNQKAWNNGEYVSLPVVNGKKIILVPKYSVRRGLALNSQEYYSHHILNFIQDEELRRGSSLVRVLKSGQLRPPTKKSLREKFPFSKDFLATFSEANKDVLNGYKSFYGKLRGAEGYLSNEELDDAFDEKVFASFLSAKLGQIPTGASHADEYHRMMIGILEFVFYPNLIYPRKEEQINSGRKRIDIVYTNAAIHGFFFRAHTTHTISSSLVMVECKNYSKDPANPEIDQLSGRFSVNRGKLGILVFRDVENYDLLLSRCRDTAADGRGFMLPIGDAQIHEYLKLISDGKRAEIDKKLDQILRALIS